MISIIVAYDTNKGIGIKNQLPWKISDDLKNFKTLTQEKYIVMGRKTFESIGRPLPNRKNIILTNDKSYSKDGCIIINDYNQILSLAKQKPHYEIFIIGGAQIYDLFIEHAHRLYITKVDTNLDVDCHFPKWDKSLYLKKHCKEYLKNDQNEFNFTFEIWENKILTAN